MSNKKFLWIWVPVLATVTVLVVVANVALNVAGGWVASQLGSGTYTFTNSEESSGWDTAYYTAEHDSQESVDEAAKALVEEIAAGGIVLAKNEAGALPLVRRPRDHAGPRLRGPGVRRLRAPARSTRTRP